MSPPAMRPHDDIRHSPADGIALLKPSYELRGRDGIKICDVASEKAENGIQAGRLELWDGRHGAYLRSVGLAYPEDGSRRVSVAPDSRHTLHGDESTTGGANLDRLHRHNAKGCASWDAQRYPVQPTIRLKVCAPLPAVRYGGPLRAPLALR